jgi:hypothetical protein
VRANYVCPKCGDDNETDIAVFYEGGWTWQYGYSEGDTMPCCGHVLTKDESAALDEQVADQIMHRGDD